MKETWYCWWLKLICSIITILLIIPFQKNNNWWWWWQWWWWWWCSGQRRFSARFSSCRRRFRLPWKGEGEGCGQNYCPSKHVLLWNESDFISCSMNNIIINTTNGSLPWCPPEIGDAWCWSGKAPGKLRWPTTDSRLRTKVRMKIMRRGVRCWLVTTLAK